MKKSFVKRTYCLLVLLLFVGELLAQNKSMRDVPSLDITPYCVDSIMNNVSFYAPFYETAISEYDADLYVKTKIDVVRKNLLLRYLPAMFRPRGNVRKYILETYSDLHYTAPDIYDQRVKAITGTTPRLKGASANILRYFNINVYSPALLKEKLISPISKDAKKYYKYKLERVDRGVGGHLEFTIRFIPKSKSYQLVRGYLIVSDKVWSIRELEFFGRSEYLSATCYIRLGEVGNSDEFLPLDYHIDATLRFMWNKVVGTYDAVMKYDDIEIKKTKDIIPPQKKNKYDLTQLYTFQFKDTTKVEKKEDDFSEYRMLPLTKDEEVLYDEFEADKDTTMKVVDTKKKKSAAFWGEVGDFLISDYTLDLYDVGTVKFSPLLNPFLLSYSGSDGFTYKHKIKYSRVFSNDRLLRVRPTIGYNFKRKEFYWKAYSDFMYWPKKRVGFQLNVGNGNRIYSSEVLEDLKNETDTIQFEKYELNYFKNLYVDFMNTWEVVNGLNIDFGLSANKRTSAAKGVLDSINLGEKFSGRYVSVAPRIRLAWTPGQYYYMNGDRKVNLYSKYPTFVLDWERSIKGFLGATGAHERIELDIQYKIPLTMMRTLYTRLGGGMFTNQEQLYFVDFVYFAKNNLPAGWNDDIGGAFQILDRRWYNASQWYIRGNMVYEAPFLLLPHLRKYTRSVINERIYVNALVMNQLQPYIEVGYGIGTHVFDFGVFVSNSNWKNFKMGAKITFELFNR